MSYSNGQEVESMDQVIQSGQSLAANSLGNPRDSDSHLSLNKTAPLPPVSMSNGNHRRDKTVSNPRSSTHAGQENRRGWSSGPRTETPSSRNVSVRQSDEASASSRSGTGTVAGSSNNGNSGANMADFFSSEVFSIVIHNPTTAHRFLRFCQSRACGENMVSFSTELTSLS